MMKAIFSDSENKTLTILNLIFASCIYLYRSISDEPIGGAGFGLFFLIMAFSPVLCIVGVGTLVYVGWILYRTVTKSAVSLATLIIFVLLAVLLPIPPGHAEKIFYEHRSDYEAVVELARQNKLGHGECIMAFAVPIEYQEWANDCVSVFQEDSLAVEFNLPTSYHALVYVETEESLHTTYSCGKSGYIYKKLEEHWYLCSHYSG